MFNNLVRLLLMPVAMLFGIRIYGERNIPQKGGLIICSNHKSVFDPIFLSVRCGRRIRYMAKSELFEQHGPLFRGLLYALGAFPVKRDSADFSSLRKAMDIVKKGGVLGIFPQGHCIPDQTPFEPKRGIALIAAKTGADVLPASIYASKKIHPFVRVTVRFGKLIPASALALSPQSGRKEMVSAAKYVADRINGLLEEKH